eukprot:gnl/TRDRNA2_/TRDRNA2_191497_c0_seq1.p1 gnl/TRDRNA2_/TRDRNA2_191497_c0~~gnl/TRDRNA2_/TRDRNA2_191497_c0_seq1.p1  ORF type:complete len:198 (+),score=48.22 gnl/TRDRNA2_/TRDRNA2_191497_c0_seq1:74-667(+)
MTNYSKWDKLAAELHEDTDSEEEADLKEYTTKSTRYIHIPPGDFTQKRQLCKLLEEHDDFKVPESGAIEGEEVDRARARYGWQSVGSQFIPGYGLNSVGDDCWRVFFDDNFLTTQKTSNVAARALLGFPSLGSFVVACLNRKTGSDRPISRKEVADLIIRRQEGYDAERIRAETRQGKESMEAMEKMGVNRIDLSGS